MDGVWIVAYDIVSRSRRYRVARLLEGCGSRIQRSVFSVEGSLAQLAALRRRMARMIDPVSDRVGFYRVSRRVATALPLVRLSAARAALPRYWVS